MSRNKEMRTNAESELSNRNKVGTDLSSLIKESDSINVKLQKQEIESLVRLGSGKAQASSVQNEDNQQYAKLIRELENVKQELTMLKLNIAVVLEEKSQAQKQVEASNSKMLSYISSVETIKKEIEERNEEQVLVELARIEALKEYGEIEAQREKEADEFSSAIENNMKKMKDIIEKIDHSKEIESKLTLTLSNVEELKNELSLVKENNTKNDRGGNLDGSSLKAVNEELEAAKKELALVREEGFQCMASMDIIRNEMKHITGEKARLKRIEEKADLTVQSLNSKILRAKAKLEGVSKAEEKAKSTVSNLSLTLEQLKTEAEAARKEKEHISEETATIKEEIQKTDSNEERLQVAMEELEEVKASEALALENLKSLIENTMKARAKVPQQSSSTTISKFEYEYLIGRAVGAQEIADKKVAAAQAWIEAIKASEKEILIQTELAQREIREMKLEEEKETYKAQRSSSAKRLVEGELQNGRQKRVEKTVPENLQPALSNKAMKGYGTPTPSRRANYRKSVSPATRHSNSFTMKKRTKHWTMENEEFSPPPSETKIASPHSSPFNISVIANPNAQAKSTETGRDFGAEFPSMYRSIFQHKSPIYSSLSVTPSTISTSAEVVDSNTTEQRLEHTRLMLEHQHLSDLCKLYRSRILKLTEEVELVRYENTELLSANTELVRLLSSQVAFQSFLLSPSSSPNGSLVDDFHRFNFGGGAPPDVHSSDELLDISPTSVIENKRFEGPNPERISLPKSISVRSSGYQKTNQPCAINDGPSRVPPRSKAPSQVDSGIVQQKVYVRVPGVGSGEKTEEEAALELEVYNQGMFKTELCNKWQETGTCPYGDHCQFAHGITELRPVIRHPRYKTEVCRMILAGGRCPYGHRCHFRHSLTEEERSQGWP